MLNDIAISIIVPVYKVERYLPRCIDSILGQTYTNFELILVDDGTPDRSGIICDRYAEKDSRIKVIHKENGGVSTARNAGIDAAKGEWITFIDSDDWVAEDYLEVLYTPLKEYDCDLTVGALEWRSIFVSSSSHAARFIDVEKADSTEILDAINRTEFYGPCLKLFKSSIIKNNEVRFPEKVLVAEDAIFVNSYLKHCKKMYLTGRVIYFYNELNAYSVTKRSPYFKNLPLWSIAYIHSYEKVLQSFLIDDAIKITEVQKKAFFGYASVLNSIVSNFDKKDASEKIKQAYNLYSEWLDRDDLITAIELEHQKELAINIQSANIDFIYDYFSRSQQKRRFKKIRCIARKVIVYFLEKYRDNITKIQL